MVTESAGGCRLFEGIVLADKTVYDLTTLLACCTVTYFLAAGYALGIFGIEIALAEAAIILGENFVVL